VSVYLITRESGVAVISEWRETAAEAVMLVEEQLAAGYENVFVTDLSNSQRIAVDALRQRAVAENAAPDGVNELIGKRN
jgi:hypothetical protein